jgi:hypothetical protein
VRRRLILLALALFVAFDILVVALAVRHAQEPAQHADSASGAAVGAGRGTPEPSAAASPTSTPSSSVRRDPGPVAFLAVGKDKTLLRSTRGDCRKATSPSVSVSRDDGASFTASTVPGLREVLAAQVVAPRSLELVGLDARCGVGRYDSSDAGRSWSHRPGSGDTWHLSRNSRAFEVVSPAGRRTVPCPPVAVSTGTGGVVHVLCAGRQILASEDAGASWVSAGRLDGAVDARFVSPGVGVALARQPGCPAAVMRSSDGGASWSRLVCLPGKPPRAVAGQGEVIAAQVGDQVFVSTDNGATWPRTARR